MNGLHELLPQWNRGAAKANQGKPPRAATQRRLKAAASQPEGSLRAVLALGDTGSRHFSRPMVGMLSRFLSRSAGSIYPSKHPRAPPKHPISRGRTGGDTQVALVETLGCFFVSGKLNRWESWEPVSWDGESQVSFFFLLLNPLLPNLRNIICPSFLSSGLDTIGITASIRHISCRL